MNSESYFEQKVKKWCDAHGIDCLKLQGPNGWPDRTLLYPNGECRFIEFKTKTGRLSKQQQFWLDHLRKKGFLCLVARKYDETIQWIEAGLFSAGNN